MFAKNKSLIGLDIGSAVVKAVEVGVSGDKIVVTGYGTFPVTAGAVEDSVRGALKAGKIDCRRVATAISGRKVVVRYFPVQGGLDHKAIRDVVEKESSNYIPFDLNQVEKDFFPVPTKDAAGAESTKVVLVAAKSEEIEDRYKILRNCGLIPIVIDIDTFAIGNAFELWTVNTNHSVGDQVTGLVDIGASKTTINIIQGTVSNFSREVYIGSNDMRNAISKKLGQSEAESEKLLLNFGDHYDSVKEGITPVLEDIGNEIRLSIDFYENQFETEVREIFVSGGILRFPGILEILGQIFYLPTQGWDPLAGVELASGVDATQLRTESCQLAVAVGLASRALKRT